MKTILLYLINRIDLNTLLGILDDSRHKGDIQAEMVGRYLDT